SLAWGTWYFSLTDVLGHYPPQAGLQMPETALKDLRQLLSRPYTDAGRGQVAQRAREAAKPPAGWLPALRPAGSAWDVQALGNALDERARKGLSGSSWDQAAQLYLALSAQRPEARRKELLQALWKGLELPPKYDSPRGFDPDVLGEKLKQVPRQPGR